MALGPSRKPTPSQLHVWPYLGSISFITCDGNHTGKALTVVSDWVNSKRRSKDNEDKANASSLKEAEIGEKVKCEGKKSKRERVREEADDLKI